MGYSVGFNLYCQEVTHVIPIAVQPKSLFNQLQMVQGALRVDRRYEKHNRPFRQYLHREVVVME